MAGTDKEATLLPGCTTTSVRSTSRSSSTTETRARPGASSSRRSLPSAPRNTMWVLMVVGFVDGFCWLLVGLEFGVCPVSHGCTSDPTARSSLGVRVLDAVCVSIMIENLARH
eukprot:2650939-Rhodomonas_salina.1